MRLGAHRPETAASRAVQEDFDFLGPPSRVGQRLRDILSLQVGILAENFFPRLPGGDEPTTVPTVTRMPRMQGFPPITAGSRVTRVNSGMPGSSGLLLLSSKQLGHGRVASKSDPGW